MKKIVALLLVFTLVLVGCSTGVSQEDYDDLDIKLNRALNERDNMEQSLNGEIEGLSRETEKLKAQIESQQKEIVALNALLERDTVKSPIEVESKDKSEAVEAPKVQEKSDVQPPPTTQESKPTEEKQSKSSAATATMGQRNALSKAKDYLAYTSFSKKGLIEQLEFEKFSYEDAAYAAENCGADWKEQAVKKAKGYLDYSSFSREGLIEQLEYEGFTNEQAVYGVNANGY